MKAIGGLFDSLATFKNVAGAAWRAAQGKRDRRAVVVFFEKGAIAHSYACRAGKGQHAAVTRVRHWARRGDAFLKVDVVKYYDSIPHDGLRLALARRFRERRVLALFDRLLASHEHRPGHGLPIGALTSQYLGNFYLEPVDHWVHQGLRIPRYARYMDDLLLITDPARLHEARAALIARLADLCLEAKHGGAPGDGEEESV